MKNIRKIIMLIMCLIFGILLFIESGLLFVKINLINEKYYLNIADETDVASKVYDKVNQDLKLVLIKNNIIIDNDSFIISKDVVNDSFNQNISDILNYMNGKSNSLSDIDISKFEEEINKYLDDTLGASNNSGKIKNEDIINNIKNECIEKYKNDIDCFQIRGVISSSFVNKITSMINKISSNMSMVIALAFILLDAIVIWKLCGFDTKMFLKYIGVNFSTLGILIISIFVGGTFSKSYNVTLFDNSVTDFLNQIIYNYFIGYINIGIIYLIIGILLLIIYFANIKKYNE